MDSAEHNGQYFPFYRLSIYSAFIACKIVHKCWLLCKIPHLFSWENITPNIFYFCAKTKDSIDSDTISNIRIIYRMCREGDKLADSCLKQTTLFLTILFHRDPLEGIFLLTRWYYHLVFIVYWIRASLEYIFSLRHKTFSHGAFAKHKMLSKHLQSSIK